MIIIGCYNPIIAQTKLTGIVTSENITLFNVEVINTTKKTSVKSNDKGEFQINADVNDEIIFFFKNYLQKNIKILKEHLNIHNKITLTKRPIELDEIKIVKAPKVTIINSYESLKIAKIEKEQSRPKVIGVYTGEIQNGIDFMAIGNKVADLIGKIFKKNDDIKKSYSKTSFEDYLDINFEHEYLIRKLNLQENEFELFLSFCKKSNEVNDVINKNNKLDVFEFLIKKRKEFRPD